MTDVFKLTYFNITALGEPIRLLLTYGKIDFEDNRVTFEDWPSIKETMPYGQLPILEHNGKTAHQSLAICRYLAKKVQLDGKDDWENLEIDSAAETLCDLKAKIAIYYYEKDPFVKEIKKKQTLEEILPFYLKRLESQIEKNDGFLACGKLTWADFYLVGLLDYLNTMLDEDLTEKYPGIKGIQEKLYNIPEIKQWVSLHPKSEI